MSGVAGNVGEARIAVTVVTWLIVDADTVVGTVVSSWIGALVYVVARSGGVGVGLVAGFACAFKGTGLIVAVLGYFDVTWTVFTGTVANTFIDVVAEESVEGFAKAGDAVALEGANKIGALGVAWTWNRNIETFIVVDALISSSCCKGSNFIEADVTGTFVAGFGVDAVRVAGTLMSIGTAVGLVAFVDIHTLLLEFGISFFAGATVTAGFVGAVLVGPAGVEAALIDIAALACFTGANVSVFTFAFEASFDVDAFTKCIVAVVGLHVAFILVVAVKSVAGVAVFATALE
jgi:hypothetical protein